MEKVTMVIPAGGPGGGMYPLTAGMPKSLVPIDNKPMLIHILESLDPEVFDRVIISSDKYFRMVKSYTEAFTHDFPIKIELLETHKDPTKQLVELKEKLTDPFAIHFTDIITGPIEWKKALVKYHEIKNSDKNLQGLLFLSKNYPLSIGVVKPNPSNPEYIGEFLEKPGQILDNYVNMAVALFSQDFISEIKPEHTKLFGESVPSALSNNKTFTFLEHEKWLHFQRMGEWVDYQSSIYNKPSK